MGRCPSLLELEIYVLFDPAIPFLGIHLGDILACVAERYVEEGPGSIVWKSKDTGDHLVSAIGAWLSQSQTAVGPVRRSEDTASLHVVATGQLRCLSNKGAERRRLLLEYQRRDTRAYRCKYASALPRVILELWMGREAAGGWEQTQGAGVVGRVLGTMYISVPCLFRKVNKP